MSFFSLVFGINGPDASIGTIDIDALSSEVTEIDNEVTEYVVEDGEPNTDHITRGSERLSLTGTVSAASVLLLQAGGRSKLIAAKDALRTICDKRVPMTVFTGMEVYTDMGMSNLKVVREGAVEKLVISCSFKKIRKATIRTADIPPQKVKGRAKGKAGTTKAQGGKTSDVVQQSSDLYNLTKGGPIKAPAILTGTP